MLFLLGIAAVILLLTVAAVPLLWPNETAGVLADSNARLGEMASTLETTVQGVEFPQQSGDGAGYSQGIDALYEKDWDRAIEKLEKVWASPPEHQPEKANIALASAYLWRGTRRLEERFGTQSAISDFRQALFLLQYDWPPNASRYYGDQRGEMIKTLRAGLHFAYAKSHTTPDHFPNHERRAKEFDEAGNRREAIVEYGWAAELQPDNREIRARLEELLGSTASPFENPKH